MSSPAAAGCSALPSLDCVFPSQPPPRVKNHFVYTMSVSPKQPFDRASAGVFQVSLQKETGGTRALASTLRVSDPRAVCCYLGNVLHTLHGHICTRALTSLLFLAPAAAGGCYNNDVKRPMKINLCLFLLSLDVVFVCVYPCMLGLIHFKASFCLIHTCKNIYRPSSFL